MISPRSCIFAAIALLPCALAQDLPTDLESAGIAATFPGYDSYEDASASYNLRFDYQPAAVVFPTTTEQVSQAVSIAAANNVKVTAKSGGHSYIANGLGGDDGALVVDLRNMTSLSLDDSTGIAVIEAGKRLGNIALELNDGGRGMGHGTCPYVGIGGHASHGGYGFTSRMWGMSLDAIVGMDVVLANGTIVEASADKNSDVFWAMRGAGSSFGIATTFTVQTFEVPEYSIIIDYNWNLDSDTAAAGLIAFQEFSLRDDVPTYYGGEISMSRGENRGEISFRLIGGWYGPEDEVESFLQPFLDQLPEPYSAKLSGDGTYIGSVEAIGGSLDTTIEPDITDTFYTKSLITSESAPQNNESYIAFIDYLATTGFDADLDWFCQVELYGGKDSAINQVPVDATSFVRRDNLFIQQLYASSPNFEPPYPDAGFTFLDDLVTATLEPMGADYDYSAYLNYVDDRLENYEKLYYGANLPRLRKLKAQLDPDNVFSTKSTVRA